MQKSVAIIFRKETNWTVCTAELFLPNDLSSDQLSQLYRDWREHFSQYTLELLSTVDPPSSLHVPKKIVSGSILHRGAIFNVGYNITIGGQSMYNQIVEDIKEDVIQYCRHKSYAWVIDGDVFPQQTSDLRF